MTVRSLIGISVLALAVTACGGRTDAGGPHPEVVGRIVAGRDAQRGIEPPFGKGTEVDSVTAYRIQKVLNEHLAKRLGPRSGFKVGYASKASQEHNGMSEPAYGALFARQEVADGGEVRADDFLHFHIETEIAFVLKSAITEPVRTRKQVAAHVASVHPSLDIPDNRFAGAQGTPAPVDLIASGVGAHRYVLGPGTAPGDIELDELVLTLSLNGDEKYRGPAKSLMGSPWTVLIWLANKRLEQGLPLQAGEVVLTGAVDGAHAAQGAAAAGTYVGDCGALGEARCVVTAAPGDDDG